MRTLIIWIFRLLIGAITLALIVPIGATLLLKQEQVKAQFSSWVLQETGRRLDINGEVGFQPGLELRFFARDVHLQNANWARRPTAASSSKVELTIAVLPLFRGELRIDGLSLSGARLWPENHPELGSNLRLRRSRLVSGQPAKPLPEWFGIRMIQIEDSVIEYVSRNSEHSTRIRIDEATLLANKDDDPIIATARGAINDLDMMLSATAGPLRRVLARQTADINIEVERPGGDRMVAAGTIGDLIRWQDINARLETNVTALQHLSPLFVRPPIELQNLAAVATLVQPRTFSSMRLEGISASFDFFQFDLGATGKVGRLSSLQGIDLIVTADSTLNKTALPLWWKSADPPNLELVASISGSARRAEVDVKNLRVQWGDAVATANGKFVQEQGGWSAPLELAGNIPDLSLFSKQFEVQLPDPGELNATAKLARTGGEFNLEQLNLENESDGSRLVVAGGIRNVGRDQRGSFTVRASADPKFFAQPPFSLQLIPEYADVEGTFVVEGFKGSLDIEKLTLDYIAGHIDARGRIDNITRPGILDLEITGVLTDWQGLSRMLARPLPDLGTAALSARLIGEGENLFRLGQIRARTAGDGQNALLTGELSRQGEITRGEFLFDTEVSPDKVFTLLPGLEALKPYESHTGGVAAAGTLKLGDGGRWSLDGLRLNTAVFNASLVLEGSMAQLSPPRGRLDARWLGTPDRQPPPLDQPWMPGINEMEVELSLAIGGGQVQAENLRGWFRGDHGQGQFASDKFLMSADQPKSFSLELTLDDLSALLPDMQALRSGTPLDADLQMTVAKQRITARGVLRSGQSDFNGTMLLRTGQGRPFLEISGDSTNLDVDALLHPAPREQRFFSRRSLLPEWMRKYDGSLAIRAARFKNDSLNLDQLDSAITFEKGTVAVQFTAGRGEGTMRGNLQFPGVSDSHLEFKIQNLPVTAFRALMRRDIFQGGVIDTEVDLKGPGDSLSSILGGAEGTVSMDINRSAIKSTALDTVGGDLISNLLNTFNPFVSRDQLVNVECGAIRFDIKDGRAVTSNGLAMKTDRVTLLGGGEIDLGPETIRLEIAPKARKGFGISASSLAKMIRIGGTLSKPEMEASATGFFKSGAAIGAAIVSGGLSLIGQGLLDRLTANADVCAIARGRVEKKSIVEDDTRTR